MVAHTFNTSTMEVEMELDMTGQREGYKVGGDRSLGFNMRFWKESIQSEVL